jgi:polyisoprenoid-binding protein YceI
MSIARWDIDTARSQIRFAVRHLVLSKARGRFGHWSGSVTVPDGDFSRATVDVVIDASSIDTGVARRDEHLRSADYFDVKRYPEIIFTSRLVSAEAGGRLRVVGALTMKGLTREVTLDTQPIGRSGDGRGFTRATFWATAAFARRDFGFVGNPALDSGGLVIGERIEVAVDIEAVAQPAARVA